MYGAETAIGRKDRIRVRPLGSQHWRRTLGWAEARDASTSAVTGWGGGLFTHPRVSSRLVSVGGGGGGLSGGSLHPPVSSGLG